jgi:hypothetical protein
VRADEHSIVQLQISQDHFLLEANPLEDVRNTQKIAAVIGRGPYFSGANLDSILSAGEAYASAN